MNHVICGDWNARIGNMSPKINDISTKRQSEDIITNSRAPWVIELCELYGWRILNGQ
jgi:hypothetical protein